MATRTRKKQAKASRVDSSVSSVQEQLLNTVHQVWLAGLGAAAKAQSGAPKVFEELVKEGARVHANASKAADQAVRSVMAKAQSAIGGRVSDARDKASDTLEGLEKMFQTRVQRALQQMGVPSGREIEKLSARVDVLNTNIEKLTRRRTPTAKRSNGRRAAGAASHAAS